MLRVKVRECQARRCPHVQHNLTMSLSDRTYRDLATLALIIGVKWLGRYFSAPLRKSERKLLFPCLSTEILVYWQIILLGEIKLLKLGSYIYKSTHFNSPRHIFFVEPSWRHFSFTSSIKPKHLLPTLPHPRLSVRPFCCSTWDSRVRPPLIGRCGIRPRPSVCVLL